MQEPSLELVALVGRIQQLPYAWPASPDAASTRVAGRGTCAGKHALLAEDAASLGFRTQPLMMVGPLVPKIWPDLLARAGHLLEVHECLTVETDWAGPLLLDVTWHPAAIRAGLGGTLEWDGQRDMQPALVPAACYAVARENFRQQKEALRSRLYSPIERTLRDSVLAEMAERAALIQDSS